MIERIDDVMDISCAFPPVPETPAHIVLAEELGYKNAWCYDTPALQLDVWITLARAADRPACTPENQSLDICCPSTVTRHPSATTDAIAFRMYLFLIGPRLARPVAHSSPSV